MPWISIEFRISDIVVSFPPPMFAADENAPPIPEKVVDESGEDYLYPKALFRSIALPQSVKKAVLATT